MELPPADAAYGYDAGRYVDIKAPEIFGGPDIWYPAWIKEKKRRIDEPSREMEYIRYFSGEEIDWRTVRSEEAWIVQFDGLHSRWNQLVLPNVRVNENNTMTNMGSALNLGLGDEFSSDNGGNCAVLLSKSRDKRLRLLSAYHKNRYNCNIETYYHDSPNEQATAIRKRKRGAKLRGGDEKESKDDMDDSIDEEKEVIIELEDSNTDSDSDNDVNESLNVIGAPRTAYCDLTFENIDRRDRISQITQLICEIVGIDSNVDCLIKSNKSLVYFCLFCVFLCLLNVVNIVGCFYFYLICCCCC